MKLFILAATFVFSSFTFACGPEQICSGDRVVFDGQYVGTVVDVFSNGMVRIDSNSFSYYVTKNVVEVSKGMNCVDRFCRGDRVHFNGQYVGTVEEVFKNGTLKINSNAFSYFVYKNLQVVGKGLPCVGRICRGNRVVFNGQYVGTVEEVFDNGQAKINSNSFSYYVYKEVNSIGKGYSCVEGVCVGNKVLFNNAYTGIVEEIFDNGTAKINSSSFSYYVYKNLLSLGVSVSCGIDLERSTCQCQ